MDGEARFAALPDVLILSVAAQRDVRKFVPARSQLAHQVVAAALWQAEIADKQVEGVMAGEFQGCGHVSSAFNRVAVHCQPHSHHLRRAAVVFDQQDAQKADRAPQGRGGRRLGTTDRRAERHPDAKCRPLVAAVASDTDLSSRQHRGD